MLPRSRGAIGRVRAAPGALPTAGGSADGPDERADGIPGLGKGLSIGLSSIFRVFDVNVALCTTTAARSRPSGWWRMVTSDGIKSDWERFSKIRARHSSQHTAASPGGKLVY